MPCGNCGQNGHNALTCKAAKPVVRPAAKAAPCPADGC